jgi:RES domain-containing protein
VTVLWRISARRDLEGLGGEKADGRWHTAARGKRIVYLAEHPALALVEVLVNLKGRPEFLPETYQLLKVTSDEPLESLAERAGEWGDGWQESLDETRAAGDAWLAEGRSALLAVPSAAVPESVNYLLNPLHADARKLGVEWAREVRYDQRLFRAAR